MEFIQKLDQLEKRFEGLNRQMADPAVIGDAAEYRKVTKAHSELSEVVAKYLRMIQQEAFRCKHITQRLLEFSRSGERRREHTDLGEVVQSVLDIVQTLPNSRGKQVVFQPAGRLLPWINQSLSLFANASASGFDSV